MESKRIKITECPRDAMQGIQTFIPTDVKAEYLNKLLLCGFDRLDFGSFVSSKAIPQLQDTAAVLKQLKLTADSPELLAIVANKRGAEDACQFDEIAFLGYPFSVSETFQMRNTNATIAESIKRVEEISMLASKQNKKLLIYLSMAFGNPYGDEWAAELVLKWAQKMNQMGIHHIALADTTGISDVALIEKLFSLIIPALPNMEITAHLHSLPQDIKKKMKAALSAGCKSFDGAINGIGGCPMASDQLTGNMDTILIFETLLQENCLSSINEFYFIEAKRFADNLFLKYNH